ncbi:MAG: carbohydrate ABC transporter permease [Candidatus Nanopelagicales bacterium]
MFRYTKLTFLREVITILASIALLMPFYFLVTTSMKTESDVLTGSSLALPNPATLDSFRQLLQPGSDASGAVLNGLLSSVLITAMAIVGLIVLGAPAAYVFARSTTRWTSWTFYIFLVAILLPTQLGVLPLYVMAKRLHLLGSPWGMAVIYIGLLMPLSVFLYAGFFRRLPHEYEEAAAIDGASRTRIFTSIVFPLMGPATGTVAILAGLIAWNDFFTPLIFLNGSRWATLPVAMYNYVGSLISQWQLIFAIVLISMVPILILYFFAQKKFIQGYAGGLKG